MVYDYKLDNETQRIIEYLEMLFEILIILMMRKNLFLCFYRSINNIKCYFHGALLTDYV